MLLGASLPVYILMLTLMPHVTPHRSCPKFDLSSVNPTCSARKMRISEGPGPPPRACPAQNNSQCLSPLSARPCADPGRFRFEHCREFALADALSDTDDCRSRLDVLRTIDSEVGILLCSFDEILRRYDCETSYSVAYDCSHCREAYRRWLCASVLAYYGDRGEGRVKPCRSICYAVQQKCPFFLPGDTNQTKANQYAGEPSFVCLDPNIPETGEQMENSMYGETCCYDYCDSNPNNGTQFCIHNRTTCLNNKYKPMRPSCSTSMEQTDPGYYYFSPPAACTSGADLTSPSTSLLSMFVLVISVPTLVNMSTAMLPLISSSLIILSMLKLQLKSILKSLLSCLLSCSPPPCLLNLSSWLRLLFVSCLTFVISCLFCLLRILATLLLLMVVVLYPTLNEFNLIKSKHLNYYGILLNVSFNSIVRILHKFTHFFLFIKSLPRNFYKLTFYFFSLSFDCYFKSLILLTPPKFNMIRFPSIIRTDRDPPDGAMLLLVTLSKMINIKTSQLILTLTNLSVRLGITRVRFPVKKNLHGVVVKKHGKQYLKGKSLRSKNFAPTSSIQKALRPNAYEQIDNIVNRDPIEDNIKANGDPKTI
ncbi:uncharacterized protein LOC103512642 [Diaphorina citri]|uniref:Uncharacterized protein LOC103512642 n=1 Tax=Diaphorina citri TaxID=121845 RepID=A0A3Q0J581_DIACI|nr:uncharacterized protein LOC103512642 [Diaphorina citri]